MKVKFISIKHRFDNDTDFLIVKNSDLEIFYFSSTAKEMLEMILEGNCSINTIFCGMKKKYEIPESDLKRDIIEFMRDLQWKKIISLNV